MGAEVALLSNILHDWDIHDAREIVRKCSQGLPEGGRIVVHDVFLKDDLSGPLAPALYSAHLYLVTEGRLYSALEVQSWLEEFGFQLVEKIPTRVHCSALVGLKVR